MPTVPPPETKNGLVLLPIDEIYPAPENELIYRPILPSDPEIRELARSIHRIGLREPIVVSRDHYILSGHRRYAACKLAGLQEIPCRFEDIDRASPDWEMFLREYNRQRVKDFDEMVRESVISHNPENAYQALREHRKAESRVCGKFLNIEGEKIRRTISSAKRPMLNAVIKILEEQRDYWPLSDRTIHYYLLNDPPLRHASKPNSRYRNQVAFYKDLCDLLTRARLVGEIPFEAIADPTRTVRTWDMNKSVGGFVERELKLFLRGYRRNLQQSQPNHIEIVGEKNTIEGSIRGVAMEYCIPYTLGRGYASLDPRYKMCRRFRDSGKEKLIILILSDFDPEGEDITHSFARSMRDDFGIEHVLAKKVCLTYEQAVERNIPQTFEIKKTSSRYEGFAKKYGDRAHELEALPPADRARLLTESILEVMDIDAFNAQVEAEKQDAARIAGLLKKVGPALASSIDTKPTT